ncbi:ribonuclease D [Alcanivorax sp. ZXX171]|nr:ribonuclease D [Alcanivorax sp. ZXX171]
MTYIWCDSAEALGEWTARLPAGAPLYLDTEFMRERTYYPRLALVQVHDGEAIRLIDTTRVAAADLAPALADRPLVMHACSEDLEALAAFSGAYPAAVEDTQIAAALTGEDMQLSYQRLVESRMGVSLPKGATRTDWLKRPLSEEQLRYAEDDVKYLPELAEGLREDLMRLGRAAWWDEECARLREDALKRAEPGDAWRQVKGAGALRGQELAVLEALAQWREDTARERDLPKGFVLRDNTLLDLCRARSLSRERLRELGMHPKAIRRDGDTVLALASDAAGATPPAPLPGPLEPAQRQTVKRLREEVSRIADDLALKPDVLVRRRWLEALVRDPERLPEPLTGWRHDLVARPLLESL